MQRGVSLWTTNVSLYSRKHFAKKLGKQRETIQATVCKGRIKGPNAEEALGKWQKIPENLRNCFKVTAVASCFGWLSRVALSSCSQTQEWKVQELGTRLWLTAANSRIMRLFMAENEIALRDISKLPSRRTGRPICPGVFKKFITSNSRRDRRQLSPLY